MKKHLADIISKLHSLILIVAIFGWIIGNTSWLKVYVVALGVILIQWLSCQNRCVLTIWEDQLRDKRIVTPTESPDETFIGRVIHKLVGWRPSDQWVNMVSYALIIVLMLIAFFRIHYGI